MTYLFLTYTYHKGVTIWCDRCVKLIDFHTFNNIVIYTKTLKCTSLDKWWFSFCKLNFNRQKILRTFPKHKVYKKKERKQKKEKPIIPQPKQLSCPAIFLSPLCKHWKNLPFALPNLVDYCTSCHQSTMRPLSVTNQKKKKKEPTRFHTKICMWKFVVVLFITAPNRKLQLPFSNAWINILRSILSGKCYSAI